MQQAGPTTYLVLTPNSTGAASANSTAINNAMAAASAAGGGTIQLSCGDYYFGPTIDNKYPYVLVSGPSGAMPRYYDSGSPTFCAHFIATQSGTLAKLETPFGVGNVAFSGGGFQNIMLDANSVSTRLLDVESRNNGIVHVFTQDSQGAEAVYFGSGVSGTDTAGPADTQHMDIDIFGRQLDGTAAQAAHVVTLDGSSNANFSLNNNVRVQCQVYNGDCIHGLNADNNRIWASATVAGTGRLALAGGITSTETGFNGNSFTHATGGAMYAQGTDTSGVTSGVHNSVQILDTGNGTPTPTAGTASNWTVWNYNNDNTSDFQPAPVNYTPTVAAVSGSFTGYTLVDAQYVRNNKTITVWVTFLANATSVGGFTISLPTTAAAYPAAGSGFETNDGKLWGSRVTQGGTTFSLTQYDGSAVTYDAYFTATITYNAT